MSYTLYEQGVYVEEFIKHCESLPPTTPVHVIAKTAIEMLPRLGAPPSTPSVLRWVLSTGYEIPPRVALPRVSVSDQVARARQRDELLRLINREMKLLKQSLSEPDPSINYAQRLSQLASANATLSTQARADELHVIAAVEKVAAEIPAGSLEEWDGRIETLPADLPEGIIDIEASRRAASALMGGAAS